MKNKLFILMFFISTLSVYSQDVTLGEYDLINSTIPVFNEKQLIFPLEIEDTSSTEESYGAFFGRNKVGLDFTPNIFMYGIPSLLNSAPAIVSSGLPFGLDSMLSADTFGGHDNWKDFTYDLILDKYPSLDLSGSVVNTKDVFNLKNLNIKAKSGTFGMRFNYDFVVTSWLAVAFDVQFMFGGIEIAMGAGLNAKDVMKSVVKDQLLESFLDSNSGVNIDDLNDLWAPGNESDLADLNDTWDDMIADGDFTAAEKAELDALGSPSDYDSFDDFFDAVYETDAFKDYLANGGSSGTSATSTTVITDTDSNSNSEIISAILDGALDDFDLNVGISYKFVEHSLGLKFFPKKRAPWGFYIMPKVGISYINISAYVDVDGNDALYDVIAQQSDLTKDDFPYKYSILDGWGAYAGLEMGWQVQLAPKLTESWPVELGLDIALFDLRYYFKWGSSRANESVYYLDEVQDMITSMVPTDFNFLANLRGSFFPKIAFSVRF